MQQALRRVEVDEPRQKRLLLVCPGVNFVDLTGAGMLAQEARRRRAFGGDLFVFAMKSQGREAMRESGSEQVIGADHFFLMGSDPMNTIVPKLDPDICATCTRRIFTQCAAQPGGADAPARVTPIVPDPA